MWIRFAYNIQLKLIAELYNVNICQLVHGFGSLNSLGSNKTNNPFTQDDVCFNPLALLCHITGTFVRKNDNIYKNIKHQKHFLVITKSSLQISIFLYN